MKVLAGLVDNVGKIVDGLSVSATEKKEIRSKLVRSLYEYATHLEEAQASVIRTEAQGNWLQKSWRPIVMLTFTFIVLVGAFYPLPLLKDTSEFWSLLEIGLGGYVIGRSVEKVTDKLRKV